MDAQDDNQNLVRALLGPNSSLDEKAVEAIARETARKLEEMAPRPPISQQNPDTVMLIQMMQQISESLREVTQSNQKVADLCRSLDKPISNHFMWMCLDLA